MEGKKTRLSKPSKLSDQAHEFTFDYSYCSLNKDDDNYTDQETIFNDLGLGIVDCAFEGFNACVFAYGQTGSGWYSTSDNDSTFSYHSSLLSLCIFIVGKTFTMMGVPEDPEKQGLVPRICRKLFSRIKLGQQDEGVAHKVHVSYLEIYNEKVRDLLGQANTNGHTMRVREHPTNGPYVENLSQHLVTNFKEIYDCMVRGNRERTTASTMMNDSSSRSHAIFTITFVQAKFNDGLPSETVSKIHLVDLAGSERADATGATGQRLKEGAHINKSLVTLGSVISQLADLNVPQDSKKRVYIPYRDSTLTWLLKDSLGGNSKTIMIAAISPADVNYGETLSTLRYASRAKNIVNKPTVNEDVNVKLIRELREEISSLRGILAKSKTTSDEPNLKMLENLHRKEAQEKVLIEEWSEKWRAVQTILKEDKSLGLKKSGIGITLDSEEAHLIGINEDVTGVTLFTLKEGKTFIGSEAESSKNENRIVLTGCGIQPDHCSIVIEKGQAVIYPEMGAQCWLNANPVTQPTPIGQADLLLLGSACLFRFNNPSEAAVMRTSDNKKLSRLNLSRLSIIAASSENLNNESFEVLKSIARRQKGFDVKGDWTEDQLASSVESSRTRHDSDKTASDGGEEVKKELMTKTSQLEECYMKIKELDEQLKSLQKENLTLQQQQLKKEAEESLRARKQSLTLELKNTTLSDAPLNLATLVTSTSTDQDSFHTAKSEFMSPMTSTPLNADQEDQTTNKQLTNTPQQMMDSGYIETKTISNSHEKTSPVSSLTGSINHLHLDMSELFQKITERKAQIMRAIENDGDKTQIDRLINELQELQREYVMKEMRCSGSDDKSHHSGGGDTETSSTATRMVKSSYEYDPHGRNGRMSAYTRNNSMTSSLMSQQLMCAASLPNIRESWLMHENSSEFGFSASMMSIN